TRVFKKILHKNIKLEEFKTETLLPAIYYLACYYKPDTLKKEKTIPIEQKEEIMKFIIFLNKEQNNFDFKTL
ncbi:hypothetical protein KZ870_38970, partial [Pseudomonas aeruginosa]|nr:hypothetical protein [Pseudomonas aeruginosa]